MPFLNSSIPRGMKFSEELPSLITTLHMRLQKNIDPILEVCTLVGRYLLCSTQFERNHIGIKITFKVPYVCCCCSICHVNIELHILCVVKLIKGRILTLAHRNMTCIPCIPKNNFSALFFYPLGHCQFVLYF